MLRATVSLSRRDPCSERPAEFALSLDGEILASPDDHEAVLERISELFDLVEEALSREIEDFRPALSAPSPPTPSTPPPTGEAATPKQLRYLHTLAGRKGITSDGRCPDQPCARSSRACR